MFKSYRSKKHSSIILTSQSSLTTHNFESKKINIRLKISFNLDHAMTFFLFVHDSNAQNSLVFLLLQKFWIFHMFLSTL